VTVKAILTDIEGTTSSLSFVKDILFPYARQHLGNYVRAHANAPQVAEQLESVRRELGNPGASLEEVIATLERWIDEDRKITPLKTLQGFVWEKGYLDGDFTGHVYEDAVAGLQRWKQQGLDLYVYSSGSVQAQKLLFGYSDAGDLTDLFSGYFDTRIGSKRDMMSYSRIATECALAPEKILFLSDTFEELAAAHRAGMQVLGLSRGLDPMAVMDFTWVRSFDEVDAYL